jgi:putative transposase
MPARTTVFATNEIYHILNRGVASQPIFKTPSEYKRFVDLIDYYSYINIPVSFSSFFRLAKQDRENIINKIRKENQVQIEIYSYCLMPNHFHFLLKQIGTKGIQRTFSKVQNAYAKYFNIKNERVGPIFQSRFKAVHIDNDEVFLHVSRYIHLNPSTSYLVEPENLRFYKWSSYTNYLGESSFPIVNTKMILKMIGGKEAYQKFVLNQADYQRKLGNIKHALLE